MSNWTHVAGIIRIDALRFDELNKEEEMKKFDKLIGKELDYDDFSELYEYASNHPEEYLPLGSEGSLKKLVWINPEKHCMAAYTVSIFGDLRDHDNPNDIIEWFKSVIKRCGMIRQAIITVKNEWYGTKNFEYNQG